MSVVNVVSELSLGSLKGKSVVTDRLKSPSLNKDDEPTLSNLSIILANFTFNEEG